MKIDNKLIVIDYDPDWPLKFEGLRRVFEKVLGSDIIEIEHVGSTAIPGLKAKPIIDIDIIIEDDDEKLGKVIDKLNSLDYIHAGDLGISGREAFNRKTEKTPDDGSDSLWCRHNLYVCKNGTIGLRNHIALRDYLRKNHEKMIQYGELKQKLAKIYPENMDSYCDAKTDFIIGILNELGFDEDSLNHIKGQNKLMEK